MKTTLCCAVGFALVASGVALAVPVASDTGAGATEYEATSLIGGAPYLTPHDPGSPYGVAYVADVFGSGSGGAAFQGPASPAGAEDLIFAGTSLPTLLTGDWGAMGAAGVQSISGAFYAGSGAPSVTALSVFFLGNSGALWMMNLTPAPGWKTFRKNLIFAQGWYDLTYSHGEGDFNSDIATTVNQVGYRVVYHPTYPSANFGIGDLTLNDEVFVVPEPQTYAMLGMALVSLGVTFRRRLNLAVDSVRSAVTG